MGTELVKEFREDYGKLFVCFFLFWHFKSLNRIMQILCFRKFFFYAVFLGGFHSCLDIRFDAIILFFRLNYYFLIVLVFMGIKLQPSV